MFTIANSDPSAAELEAIKSMPTTTIPQPLVPIAAQLILYVLGAYVFIAGLGEFGAVFAEAAIFRYGGSTGFWIVPALAVMQLLAAGSMIIMSASMANKETIRLWKVSHWTMSGVTIALLLFTLATRLLIITAIIIATAVIAQLVSLLIYTFSCDASILD